MTDTSTTPLVRDRRRQLRVKIKSLAAEARIIRTEERRCRKGLLALYTAKANGHDYPGQESALVASFVSLRAHRVNDVRREARYSLLAYACIRGRPLRSVEKGCDVSKLDLPKLYSLVQRFGPERHFLTAPADAKKMVDDWLAFL